MTGIVRSLADLARLADLSAATVSRALSGHSSVNENTRARVRALATEHGYRPNQLARNLRLQRTQSIGLVLPLGHETGQHLTDPFFLTLLGHLADELVTRGYDLTLSRVIPDDEEWLDRVVDSGRIDGLILFGQSDQVDIIERVAARYDPLVVWGAALPDKRHLTVGSDNIEGGRLAAAHLLSLGRRRPLFLGNPHPPEFAQRLMGFERELAKAGVASITVPLHMTFEGATAAVTDYLSTNPLPDAIFAASDVVAVGALKALAARGLAVPGAVAVVGYDDVSLAAHTTPALTTIRQDIPTGARRLVDMLFARMGGQTVTSCILPTELVVRASTTG